MNLDDIDEWNVGALNGISNELTTELNTAAEVAAELEKVSALPGWDSPAADRARNRIKTVRGNVLDDTAVLGAVQQLAEETALAVTKLQTELAGLRALVAAQDGHLSLASDGEVSISGSPEEVEKLQKLADDIETRAKALIRQAQDIDNDCAEVFGHIIKGDVTAHGATDAVSAFKAGEEQSGLSAPYPPTGPGTEPKDSTAWWNALSAEEQQKVIAEHPDWINNNEGIPTEVRNPINRARLDQAIADEQQRVPTREELAQFYPGLTSAQLDKLFGERTRRLRELQGVRNAISLDPEHPERGYDPNKFLMNFNPTDTEVNAAIAVGNPDEAQYVTVTTPGMNTHGDSMPGMVGEARALRSEIETQLRGQGVRDPQVSSIAWFGYDPPDVDKTALGAIPEDRANAGAVDLADFYRGINATNIHGSDVELSAFGHSYGSTTTAQALNELGEKGVVDNAAFYGSPGLGWSNEKLLGFIPTPITDESDLFLEQGHGFVMSARNDPVSEGYGPGNVIPSLADFGGHGPNTNTLPLEHLSSDAATTPDGVVRQGASGHSEYPRPTEVHNPDGSTTQVLRTPAYNLAIIGAGLADDPKGLLIRE